MKDMDTILASQNLTDQNLTFEEKSKLFNVYFSSGVYSTYSFSEKIEMMVLIAYLFQKINTPEEKYKTVLDMMKDLLADMPDFNPEQNLYVSSLSIIVQDLLYGSTENIPKPGDYTNATQIVDRIKTLLNQWLPF